MPDELRIRITGDVTQLTEPVEEGADKVVDAVERMQAATDAYSEASSGTQAQQEALGAAFDSATASGASFVEAMEAGVAAADAVSPANLKAAAALEKAAEASERAAKAADRKAAADAKAATAAEAEAAEEARKAAAAVAAATVSSNATEQQRAAYQRLAAATLEARIAKQSVADITAAVVAGELTEAEATNALAEAQARSALAARELSAAEAAESEVSEASTVTRRQARAELGLLTGNMKATKSAVVDLAMSVEGLGEAMSVAFAAVEVIGVLYILYQVGEKVAEIAHGFDEVAQAEERASKAAGGLLDAMDAAAKQSETVRRELIEDAQGKAGLLKYDLAHMQLTVSSNDATVIGQAQARVDELNRRIQAGAEKTEKITAGQYRGLSRVVSPRTDDSKAAEAELANAQTQLQTAQMQLDTDKGQVSHLQHQLTEQETKDNKQPKGPKDHADRDELQAIEAEYARLNAIKTDITGHGLTAADGLQFWSQYLNAFHEGSTQATKVLNEFRQAQQRVHSQIQADAAKIDSIDPTGAEGQKAFDEGLRAMAKWQLQTSEDLNHTGERWKEYNAEVAKGAEIHAATAAALEQANIRIGVANGTITKQSAAYIEAGIHADEYRAKLKALQDQLDAIKADPNLTAVQKATQSQGVQNQIDQTKGTSAVSAATDQAAISTAISAPYLKGMDAINNGWLQVQGKFILGTKNIGREFANMGATLVNSVAGSFEKMLIKQGEVELQMVLAHQAGNATKMTSDAAASTVTVATSQRTALQQIAHEAAVAAAKTYSALAGIPIVGPVLAPIGAAAAYVGVLALAAFETGGIVPKTGVVLAHEKEGILPRNLTEFLVNAADRSTGASASGSTHQTSFNQTNHYQGISDRQHRTKVMQHSDVQYASVRRELRRQGAV